MLLVINDAIDRQEKIHTCVWRFKVASCKHNSLKFTRFCKISNKVRYFSNKLHTYMLCL